MAEEVKIVIDVEGGKGAQTVKEVSKDLEKAAKSGDKMSESIKKSGGVTLDVRQKLRDLQNQMAEIGDVGSDGNPNEISDSNLHWERSDVEPIDQ